MNKDDYDSVRADYEATVRRLQPRLAYEGFRVCGKCFHIYGAPPEGPHQRQRCQCPSDEVVEDQDRWADIHRHWDFCKCCALEVHRARSRWSQYFCEVCFGAVYELNRRAGRCVVPIGPHSIMNGVFQSTRSSASIQAFADQLVTFFNASDGVHGYGTKVVAKRFRSAGFKAGQDPTLDAFISEVWKKHGSRGRGEAITDLLLAAAVVPKFRAGPGPSDAVGGPRGI